MLNYVTEAVPAFAHTWRIVRKESLWLERTRNRLFSQIIDAEWVSRIEANDDLSERVEAFASRYGRLQDTLGDKLFPRLLELIGQNGRTLIDVLNQMERIGLLQDPHSWLEWRNLRNQLVHEYMENPEEFAMALNTANDFSKQLVAVVTEIQNWLTEIGLDEEQIESTIG